MKSLRGRTLAVEVSAIREGMIVSLSLATRST